MKNVNVYLGTEVKARGWNAKVMLACYLANCGLNVIVGPRDEVERMALEDEGGVFIEKDFFHKRYIDYMKKLKELGFLLYSYDEEGLIYQSDAFYIDSRTDRDTLSILDKVFTWGNEEKRILLQAYPDLKDNFLPVGNPRIDFITEELVYEVYKSEIEKIRKDYGKYILINSTYSTYGNPRKAAEEENEILKRHTNFDVWGKYSQLMIGTYEWYDKLFESLIDAIKYISPLVDCKIVIRVHPTENMDKWKVLSGLDNVVVINKYDALPWVYNAEMLIHSNCTTGVEATLMGKKVISYMPYSFGDVKHNLPDRVSYSVKDKIELLKTIKSDKKTIGNIKMNSIISDYISLPDDNGNACQKISTVILDDIKAYNITSKRVYNNKFIYDLRDFLSSAKKYLMGINNSNSKFPHESFITFKKRERMIEQSVACDKLKIMHVANNTFCIIKK